MYTYISNALLYPVDPCARLVFDAQIHCEQD
jgi:hypothetical protein